MRDRLLRCVSPAWFSQSLLNPSLRSTELVLCILLTNAKCIIYARPEQYLTKLLTVGRSSEDACQNQVR